MEETVNTEQNEIEAEEYVLATLESLVGKELNDQSYQRLYSNKDQIDGFYTKYFNKTHQADSSYISSTSQATGFYKMIIDRISSVLFNHFPEVTSVDEEVQEFIKENENSLSDTFRKASLEYCLYGSVALQIKDGLLQVVDKYKDMWIKENVLIKKGIFTEEAAENLDELVSGEIDTQALIGQSLYMAYYKGKKYIYVEKLDEDKPGLISLKFSELDPSLCLIEKHALVDYVYSLFLSLENLYDSKFTTRKALKTVFLYDTKLTDRVKKVMDSNNNGIAMNSNYGGSGVELVKWIDNSPVKMTLDIQQSEIAILEQTIISILDMQDLFNGNVQDNPNESRIAAANRVAISQIKIESLQNKFNDFIERSLKYLLSVVLEKEIDEIDLETSSVSILKLEEKNQKAELDLQKFNALLMQSQQVTGVMSEVFLKEAEFVVSQSDYLRKKDYSELIDKLREEREQLLLSQQSNPVVDMQLAESQAKIEKTMAETNNINSKTKQIEKETALYDEKLGISKIDETQQFIDAETRAKKAEIENNNL